MRRRDPLSLAAAMLVVLVTARAHGAAAAELLPVTDCPNDAPMLVAALGDDDVARPARERLERCGRAAVPALLEGLRGDREHTRARAAGVLATLAPGEALVPIAEAMASASSTEPRAALRRALARASSRSDAKQLDALLSEHFAPDVQVDVLRALTPELPRLPQLAERATALVAQAAVGADARRRYLLVETSAVLARVGAASAVPLLDGAFVDGDAHVRARAAELSAGVSTARERLVAALGDTEPRVRTAALEALRGHTSAPLVAPVAALAAKDAWTFVRVAAVRTLTAGGPSEATDEALAARAEEDPSPPVRTLAIAALGERRAVRFVTLLRDRLADAEENADVRAAAARALGDVCDGRSLDVLTERAQRAARPSTRGELVIGTGAMHALGQLHPPDLATRLAPLLAPHVSHFVRAQAKQASETRDTCPRR